MMSAGLLHFVEPELCERVVPKWFGHERAVVAWSCIAEWLWGGLVAIPGARGPGAWLTASALVVVSPANLQMGIDAGRPYGPAEWLVWLRLPSQTPLIRWAYRHTR